MTKDVPSLQKVGLHTRALRVLIDILFPIATVILKGVFLQLLAPHPIIKAITKHIH